MSCSYMYVFTSKYWLPNIESCLKELEEHHFISQYRGEKKEKKNNNLWISVTVKKEKKLSDGSEIL